MNPATVKRFSAGIADIQHRGIQWGIVPEWKRTAREDLIDQTHRFRLMAFTKSCRGTPQPFGSAGLIRVASQRDMLRQIKNHCGRLVEEALASPHRYSVDGLPWEIHCINNASARTAATLAYIEANTWPPKTKNANR